MITGASTGIGREAAVALGRRGARLVLVGRSQKKHRPMIADLESESIEFELIEAELSDLSSIATAAGQIEKRHPEVTVLINNAGQGGRRGKTADGFELAFGVNYLSHYLLTRRLLDAFIKNSPARIVNLSSNAHYDIKSFDPMAGLGRTRSITGLTEYAHSKAAMAAFTLELAHRLVESGVKAVAVHPGLVATDGWRAIPPPFRWFMTRRMIAPAQGALPVLQAVLDPGAISGSYLTPEGERMIHPLASDPETTKRLWELSEGWVARYL